MSGKEVRFGDEARHRMVAGVNILANAVKVTLGPIKTPSFRVIPFQIIHPFFKVTLFPTLAPDSIKQLLPILQLAPMRTFFIM